MSVLLFARKMVDVDISYNEWLGFNVSTLKDEEPLDSQTFKDPFRKVYKTLGNLKKLVPNYIEVFDEVVKKLGELNKFRKCHKLPEIEHPAEVASIYATRFPDFEEWEIIAALAHDVEEDFRLGSINLTSLFNEDTQITKAVLTLTKPTIEPRERRNENYRQQLYESIEAENFTVICIKACDTYHNSGNLASLTKEDQERKALEYLKNCEIFDNAAQKMNELQNLREEALRQLAQEIRLNCFI